MPYRLQIKKYTVIYIVLLYLLQSLLPLWNAGSFVLCYAADDHLAIEFLINNKCVKSPPPIANAVCCPSTEVTLSSTDNDLDTCVDIPLSVSAERYTGRNSIREIRIPTAANLFLSHLPTANSFYKASHATVSVFPNNAALFSITSTILII